VKTTLAERALATHNEDSARFPGPRGIMTTFLPARLLPLIAAVALIAGCATNPGSESTSASSTTRLSNSDIITREELANPLLAGNTVLEAVRRLRPRFVNERGGGLQGASEVVMASYNGSELVPLAELSRMAVTEVTEIRYLNTAAAALRFGLAGSNGPVLLLTMKAH
jgi:hypothetical protein